MKGYRIYISDYYGFKNEEEFASNYSKAVQILNNKVRKAIKQLKGDLVKKEEFSEEIQRIKENCSWNDEKQIICRKMPYILWEKEKMQIVEIPYWEKQSYENDEWDIVSEDIVLEEIEIQ